MGFTLAFSAVIECGSIRVELSLLGVAQNQIGECLDQIGTVLDYEWVPFDDDPTAFGALYIQFEKTRLTLLAREWANGDDFVVPWTDKDSAILDSVKCFD